jgi:hypothetical protein
VRVALDIGESVMLAMDGNPLAGSDSRGHPENETKGKRGRGTQHKGFVSHGAVQVHGCPDVGHDSHCQPDKEGCHNTDKQ